MPESLPRTIGRYEIQRELGRGMMGVVYEARDPALGRRIALKTIQLAFAVSGDERRSFEERFLAEARTAARLSHPGIVVVHDVGQDAATGTLYIALEFLQGRTLAEVVAAGKAIDWREALRITKCVAAALHHAHAEGVIHRDIKPANIMMLPSGEPKIMDFGIAKVEASQLTATGQFFGTPLYMSPEQALGRKLDARSDIFSLGTLAYGLLTGQQPFGGTGVPRIVTRVLREEPPPPTRVVPTLPPEVDYLIARALAKDPTDRYPDARTMAEDADDILSNRPPRHRRDWVEPHRAEGTLVSARRQLEDHPDLANLLAEPQPRCTTANGPVPSAPKHPAPAPPLPRGPRALPWTAMLIAALLGGAVAAGGLLMWPRREPAAPATRMRSVPMTTSEAATAALPTPATLPPAGSPPVEELRPTPPAPVSAPVKKPAHRAQAPHAAEPPARLAIDFEHSLKNGKLRIWVDDALVVEEALGSRVTKKVVALEIRKGRVEKTLALSPGPHEVRVRVDWDDNVETEHISGHFASGRIRRLSAKLGTGVRGLVQKDLELEWE